MPPDLDGAELADYAPSTYELGEGRKLYNVHAAVLCRGRHCSIHNRSAHHMRNWPRDWDDEGQRMLCYCQHRVGHPDPDDAAFRERTGRPIEHSRDTGCDGCCEQR